MIRLTIPGTPVAKGRPRFVRKPFPRAVTPEQTVRFENLVKHEAIAAGFAPVDGPLRVTIDAFWPMRGQPRKTKPRRQEPKTTKPDGDNVAKAILDGLEGVCFLNDAAVVDLRVRKWHAAQGEMPRTEIEIEALA